MGQMGRHLLLPASFRYHEGLHGVHRYTWVLSIDFDTAQCSGSFVKWGDYDMTLNVIVFN